MELTCVFKHDPSGYHVDKRLLGVRVEAGDQLLGSAPE